jgi:RNA polymerase sigma factor (sigma-70 family)
MSDHPGTVGAPALGFEQVLADAYPVVFHRLASRFRDEQLAEEVSSDSLARAWELHRDDPDYFRTHDLAAWATRRASWRAVDRLRDRTRRPSLPEEPLDGQPAGFRTLRERDPERDADRETLRDCLERLPDRDRALLLAHYWDGLTDQQLGAALYGATASPQALGLRVWRGRRQAEGRLRDLLVLAGLDPADWGGPQPA